MDYLTYYPFEKPTECHHCEASNFYRTSHFARGNKRIPVFYCQDCQRVFSKTTNTIFSNSWQIEQWGEFGKLYLAGVPIGQIAKQLNRSKHAINYRISSVNKVMQQQYPELYQWWDEHQRRVDLTLTEKVQQQANNFYQWLDTLIHKTDYTCNYCSRPLSKDKRKPHRPYFVCHPCKKSFNPLNGTQFKGTLFVDLWPEFAEWLINGASTRDMQQHFNLGENTFRRWRKLFIEQMKELGLNDFVYWSTWQNKRRHIHQIIVNHYRTKRS